MNCSLLCCVHTKDDGNTENDFDDEDDGSKKKAVSRWQPAMAMATATLTVTMATS